MTQGDKLRALKGRRATTAGALRYWDRDQNQNQNQDHSAACCCVAGASQQLHQSGSLSCFRMEEMKLHSRSASQPLR